MSIGLTFNTALHDFSIIIVFFFGGMPAVAAARGRACSRHELEWRGGGGKLENI
jgi:hypothetical protein